MLPYILVAEFGQWVSPDAAIEVFIVVCDDQIQGAQASVFKSDFLQDIFTFLFSTCFTVFTVAIECKQSPSQSTLACMPHVVFSFSSLQMTTIDYPRGRRRFSASLSMEICLHSGCRRLQRVLTVPAVPTTDLHGVSRWRKHVGIDSRCYITACFLVDPTLWIR